MTCTEAFSTVNPAARTLASTSVSSVAPDAAAQRGSSTPKTAPRSPRPAAPSSASHNACAATSPSECPAQPSASGNNSPASQHVPAGLDRVHVDPGADANGRNATRRRGRHQPLRRQQIVGGGDLECGPVAGHGMDLHADGLHQAGVVGGRPTAGSRRQVRAPQHGRREALRRLHHPQLVAIDGAEQAAVGRRRCGWCRRPAAPEPPRARRRGPPRSRTASTIPGRMPAPRHARARRRRRHRSTASAAATDAVRSAPPTTIVTESPSSREPIRPAGGHRDHDAVDPGGEQPIDGMQQQLPARDPDERLGHSRTQAFASSSSRNDSDDGHVS